jgi:hypothetical protein
MTRDIKQQEVILKVPYFSQMDNRHDFDGPAWRHCLSSSCAMLAAFYDKVATDGDFREIRRRYGGTTAPMASVDALRELGLQAFFRQDGTPAGLKAEIDAGRPVAVGWLHHGPVSAPSGGGHWSVVIGYNSDSWFHHDPYGEAALVSGGYVTTAVGSGKNQRYSKRNWVPRWTPAGGDGWMITARP